MARETQLAPRMAVVEAVKRWIAAGELPSGAAIPSARTLSTRLHVQRPTVRRALAILERQGVIQTVGPRTRIVTERPMPMAHSIVVAARPKTVDSQGRYKGAPWGTVMFEAVMEEVGKRGYSLILTHPDRATTQDIQRLVSGCPSGVVVPELTADGRLQLQWSQALQQAGIPMVVYGGSPELATMDRVTSDHDHGSYELTRLLLGRGCRRILMLFEAWPDLYWVKGRRSGYERALAEAGVPALPPVNYGRPEIPESAELVDVFEAARRRAASYLLEYVGPLAGANRVDAIMTASDGETFAVAGACRLLGVTPGKDVLIVGYDNYWREAMERTFEPAIPLATVDKHNAAIGKQLVSLLADRIEGRLPPEPQVRVVPPQLVVENGSPSSIGHDAEKKPETVQPVTA